MKISRPLAEKLKEMRARLASLAMILVLFALPTLAGDPKTRNYDEVFDTNGEVRPQYAAAYAIYERMSPTARDRFLRESRRAFRGDNALDPMPRVITTEEYETLRKGIEQRGTALRLFLQDYYSGRKTYEDRVIPKDVIDRIIARNGESGFAGLLPPDLIAFPYGPDLVRTPEGRWAVIEDNPGFIGGPGDLMAAYDTLFTLKPEYRAALRPKNNPRDYYREIVRRARARAIPPDGRIVLYMVPPYPDHEDDRLKKLYRDLGVDVITPRTQDRLIANDQGVFIRSPDKIGRNRLERVGYIMMNGEHKWIDASHPVTNEMLVRWEAKAHLEEKQLGKKARARITEALTADLPKLMAALDRSNFVNEARPIRNASVHGLIEALFKRQVATNYVPGLDFIGDKEFYLYVDDLVRFYLHEEPVIPNLPTFSFATRRGGGSATLDTATLRALLSAGRYRNYVFKTVDGRGGDGVWIGPKMTAKDARALEARIRRSPESFIAQPYTPLSSVDDRIVDLRLISEVGPGGVLVSATPWGRGVPKAGNGKVNLSSKGREFAVLVVDLPTLHQNCLRAARDAVEGRLP